MIVNPVLVVQMLNVREMEWERICWRWRIVMGKGRKAGGGETVSRNKWPYDNSQVPPSKWS